MAIMFHALPASTALMSSDELILLALDCYAAALPRILQDVATHGGLHDASIELDPMGTILLRFRWLGEVADGVVGPLKPDVRSVDDSVVALADIVQELIIEYGPDRCWPGCLPGHTHPPVARLVAGVPTWTCARTGEIAGPLATPPATATT